MKENLTQIVCILDESGSMGHLQDDTIGSLNSFINNQKELSGEAEALIIAFNISSRKIFEGNIRDFKDITRKDYNPMNATALYDTVGSAIDELGIRLSNLKEEDRPSKVVFMIITDGQENSSEEYTCDVVKEKIIHQRDKYNWEFMFVGANIDSYKIGNNLGISSNRIANYTASEIGTRSVYASLDEVVSVLRKGEIVQSDWNKDIV